MTPWAFALVIGAAILVRLAFRAPGRAPLLSAAALLAALAVAEVGASAWLAGGTAVPSPDTKDEWRPPDGIVVPPTILPAPGRLPGLRDGRPRAVFVGDSFTEGLGVRAVDTFPARLGRALDIQALNHGVTGSDTGEQRLLWRHYGRTWAPDLVVWTFVLNDFSPQIPVGPDYLMRYEPAPLLGSSLLGMTRLVLARRAAHTATVEGYRRSLDPALDPGAFAALEDTLREVDAELTARGGRVIFVIFPLMWDLREYPFRAAHQHVAAAAARAGVEVVDLLPAFAGERAADLWASAFDHHPNARGHAIAAERLATALRDGPLAAADPLPASATPESWLRAAEAVHAAGGNALGDARVAILLAVAAARLAELDGASDGGLAPRGLDLARRYQRALEERWRPQPAP